MSFVASIVFASTLPLWCQEQATAVNPSLGPGPISLKISLDHDAVRVGSALVLTVEMTNITEDPHCYKGFGGGAANDFNLVVLTSTGERARLAPALESRMRNETWSRRSRCLNGWAKRSESQRLDELFDLSSPGTYRVQASRSLQGKPDDKALSNELTFTILP
jgi:hypothetical protein